MSIFAVRCLTSLRLFSALLISGAGLLVLTGCEAPAPGSTVARPLYHGSGILLPHDQRGVAVRVEVQDRRSPDVPFGDYRSGDGNQTIDETNLTIDFSDLAASVGDALRTKGFDPSDSADTVLSIGVTNIQMVLTDFSSFGGNCATQYKISVNVAARRGDQGLYSKSFKREVFGEQVHAMRNLRRTEPGLHVEFYEAGEHEIVAADLSKNLSEIIDTALSDPKLTAALAGGH